MPFSFMEHYGAAAGLTVIYLLLLFDLTGAALWLGRKMGETGRVCAGAHSSVLREREICWLSIFLSAFAVPFFLHRDYFGTSDELVLTFVLAALLLVLGKSGRGEQKAQSREAALEKTSLAITILIAELLQRLPQYWDFSYRMSGSAVRQAVCGHVAAVVPLRILGTAIFWRAASRDSGKKTVDVRSVRGGRRMPGDPLDSGGRLQPRGFLRIRRSHSSGTVPDGAGGCVFCRPCAGDERGDTESSADTGGVCPLPADFHHVLDDGMGEHSGGGDFEITVGGAVCR